MTHVQAILVVDLFSLHFIIVIGMGLALEQTHKNIQKHYAYKSKYGL